LRSADAEGGRDEEAVMKTNAAAIRSSLVPVLVASFLAGSPLAARAEDPAAPAALPGSASVARAVFARAVADREPQDVVSSLDPDAQEVFFFTELVGLEGRTVRHRWELDGQVMAEVPFLVGAPRWRGHSSKRLLPGQPGSWTVSVVAESGEILRSEVLQRALATPEPSSPTPPAAPER
jgi:hypothetical protein